MRNLRNTRHDRITLNDDEPVTAAAWDVSNGTLVVATGPSEKTGEVILRRVAHKTSESDPTSTRITSWNALSPSPDLNSDKILNLQCFPDTNTICLVFAGGDVVVVREDANQNESGIEIVGSVDAGLSAAAWSPDEELLVLATRANTVLLMTRDFDILSNIGLSQDDLKVSSHVSVGWGKKETQFKGRGVAKALRDPTVPEAIDEGRLSPHDDGRVTITWRGDAQYFAVSGVLQAEIPRRLIRVYSREGLLESVSEPVDGLESALSWKPSGQVIAGIQRREDRIDVVFFERNGLRHGEFSLRLDKDQMESIGSSISLQWNVDSTALAVTMQDRVQLWTMGNYHYYLKQEILLEPLSSDHALMRWHPEKALQLCTSRGSDLRSLSYSLEVCRGSVQAPSDLGMVAVIDGKSLKVTPLRIANIPPPMAFDEVHLMANAVDVAIGEGDHEIVVLHADRTVSTWTCDYTTRPPKMAVLREAYDAISIAAESGIKDHSATLNFSVDTGSDRIKYRCRNEGLGGSIAWDKPQINSSGITKVERCTSAGSRITIDLGDNGTLYIDNNSQQELRIPGCTSFVVTSTYLIYTTAQNLLKFVHIHDGNLEIPGDDPSNDERCRSIERGARIVTVMPTAYSLVLQMPRGNLETIYPRALVLAGIRQSIQEQKYKKAFLICRAHRVDMNILHDYRPGQFIDDVESFVKQLDKTEYIDLFLSSLSEEDVSETIYRDTTAPPQALSNGTKGELLSSAGVTKESKVNQICDAFLRVLEKYEPIRLQNILTAHVSKNPPDLEAGLRLVSNLRQLGDEAGLEQAIDHICFLADVNQLYDAALGLYDLDVALLVAQQSQKDPREYLPYLQNLQDMPELRRCFTIDNDLKRFAKALTHLHVLGEFDEFKEYMQSHELYNAGIELSRYNEQRLGEIMHLYADHLNTRHKFKEAAIAYEYISEYTSAYEAYRSAGLWQECLSCAACVPLEAAEFTSLAIDLANGAEESKDFQDAARIHLDLDNLEDAARLFCKAYMFPEAIRYVTLHHRLDLVKSAIDPSLIESSATMTELLAEMKSQLGAQVPRIRELRKKKAEDPMGFLDGGDGDDLDIPDNLSLAPTDASTSGGTFLTRYTRNTTGTVATNATRRTSKNRRREERKRARGKKGTFYEEEYLINSVARLIERLNTVSDEVARLVEALMRRSMRERAVAVQAAFDEVTDACKGCMQEVFQSSKVAKATVNANGEDVVRPVGGQGVLFDALTAERKEMPSLKTFERLSLVS